MTLFYSAKTINDIHKKKFYTRSKRKKFIPKSTKSILLRATCSLPNIYGEALKLENISSNTVSSFSHWFIHMLVYVRNKKTYIEEEK